MTLLMTGGTGFLGLHLLRGHLTAGRKVTLLAHAGNGSALDRVARFLAATGEIDHLPIPLHQAVTVVDVDVQLPMIGLSPTEFHELARDATELWHVAGSVVLNGQAEQVWRSNVIGTKNVLRLADHLPPHAALRYVSTAFVAGHVRQGDIEELDSADTSTFENTYERSKHAAERLVRQRAGMADRPVLILRPSILIPGAHPQEGLPEHTLSTLRRTVSRVTDRMSSSDSRLVLRVGADPRAHLNLLQVDWAAEAMLRLSDHFRSGTHTAHVVHDKDVSVRTIATAFEDTLPVRVRMMPAEPAQPTGSERWFYRQAAGFLPYLYHRRRFHATASRTLLADLAPPPPIDRAYLRDCLRPDRTTQVNANLRQSA